jgi:hypothetical protein
MVAIDFNGKHHGCEIEDVFKKDPNWCVWLLNQDFIKKRTELYDYLNDKIKDKDAYYLTWGKQHKGKTLKEINEIDKSYIAYLKKNEFVINNCKIMYKKLLEL